MELHDLDFVNNTPSIAAALSFPLQKSLKLHVGIPYL